MSRGLIALLVIGGAGVMAFFLFGGKAKAAGANGVNVGLTDGWSPVTQRTSAKGTQQVCINMGFGQKCVPSDPKAQDLGWGPGVTPPPPPPPGPTGVSNPTYLVQPAPPSMYEGQFGANPDALNQTRSGARHFN